MSCLKCNSSDIKNNGKTKVGTQRYCCNNCKKTWSDNPKRGQPTIGTVAMTDAERAKRYREKKKNKSNSYSSR